MKKKHKRLLSLFLSLVMMIVSVPVISEPLEAHAALYPYLDYSRIYGSKNAQSYDVEVSFGSMMVEGKLRHTGDYSQNQIDIAISKVLEMNGLNESDLLYAQSEIEKWEKQQEITTKDYMEICANIANIMGVGEPFDMANNLYKVFIEGQGAWETAKDMAGTLYSANEWDLYTNIYTAMEMIFLSHGGSVNADGKFVINSLGELADQMGEVQRMLLDEDALKIGNFSVNQLQIIQMVVSTVQVSVDQWKKDKKRWKDRVDAANAVAFMNSFYDAVNRYLEQYNPHNMNWVLSAAGIQGRYFSWFGSEKNYQRMNIGLSASKNTAPGTVYSNRGYRANTPFGSYTGSAGISLTHDLSSFNSNFWNLQLGILPKNWLNNLLAASSYAGHGEINRTDITEITRTLIADEVTFTIPGGYSYQYNSTIPATTGNRDVVATIPLSAFKDKVWINAVHTLDYEWGLANVQEENVTALDYVKLDLHGELSNGNLSIIFDDTQALVWIAGMTFADIKEKNITGGHGWDNNIWANMDSGIKIKVKFR